jgi:hypothetical protein
MKVVALRLTGARQLARALLVLGFLSATTAFAADRVTGSISGTVRDRNGAAVSGAEVQVKDLGSGTIVAESTTDGRGAFTASNIPEGRYALIAALSGSQPVVVEPVQVSPGQNTTVASSSRSGQVQARITVDTDANVAEESRSDREELLNTTTILELPGRQTQSGLALLAPGVVPNTVRPGSDYSANGVQPTSNYFTIDGSDNFDPVNRVPRQNLAPETLQTFRLITSVPPAQLGRLSGADTNQLTRTGQNGFHGTLMYTWNGNSFDSLSTGQKRTIESLQSAGASDASAWDTAVSRIVDNKALISGGGPLWKDRVFFFSSWDRDWFRATASPAPALAITPAGFAALSSPNAGFAPGALTFLAGNFPLANTPTDRGQINITNPATGAVTPVAIGEFSRGLTGGIPYSRDYWRFLQKLDARITNSNSLSMRYLVDELNDPGLPAPFASQEIGQFYRNHSGMINDVQVFSPTTLNEFRFTYGRIGSRNFFASPMGISVAGFNSIGIPGTLPLQRRDNAYQYFDTFGWSPAGHNFKFGIEALNYRLNAFLQGNAPGTLAFGSLSDLLFGNNAVFSQYVGNGRVDARTLSLAPFVQDDWHITQGLTLNLGLRYETQNIPEGLLGQARRDRNNFSPRVGFAWSPNLNWLGGGTTVIRGGYSIMYDNIVNQVLMSTARNYPGGIAFAGNPTPVQFNGGNFTAPFVPTVDEFTAVGGNPSLLPSTVLGLDENQRIRMPYVQQWNFGIEQQIFHSWSVQAFYVGSRGVHLLQQVERNPGVTAAAFNANPDFFSGFGLQPVIGSRGAVDAYRLNPAMGSITSIDPIGSSIYHSGQFSLIKRFGSAVNIGAHYTYSSYISTNDDFLTPASNPFDLRSDRGRSIFDQPHRFVANYVFRIPGMKGDAILDRVLSGWEVSGITEFASGVPYGLYNGANAFGLLPGMNPQVFGYQRISINPNGIHGLASSGGILDPFFVGLPANSGSFGNLGRNTFRTPQIRNTDLALVKTIKTFSDNQALQLRAEGFNVFNRKAALTAPINVVTSDTNLFTFMNPGQVDAYGRRFMFTARYFF